MQQGFFFCQQQRLMHINFLQKNLLLQCIFSTFIYNKYIEKNEMKIGVGTI